MQQQIRDLSGTKKVMVKISYVFLENIVFNKIFKYTTKQEKWYFTIKFLT
jgi:hypothetical protein